jgi:uncharacterized protein
MSDPVSMYRVTVPVLQRALRNLAHVLDKGYAHAQARKIEPAVLLGSRLAPDMLPLTRQVQIAADIAKAGAARLAGVEPPAYEDTETTFDELQARIARTLEFIGGIATDAFDGAAGRRVSIKLRGAPMDFEGLHYWEYFVIPNVFFHATTAYAILRHNGVELGKADFLGAP